MSLESGALRRLDGWKGVVADREAVGRRKEFRIDGMDFVRKNVGARWVVRKEEDAKSF